MSRTLIIAVAVLAVFACAFATAEAPAAAVEPRFAEAEMEDQAVVAEQQAEFESTLEADEIEDEAEEEEEESDEESDEAEDESEEEEADESEEEESEEAETESESEEEEESEEEADEESEEEADEESEEEESETEFVLAELQDSAVSTGFMEMTAKFVPTAPRTAEHLVHSASSETAAIAKQHYMAGHADGFMAASASANSEEEESEDGEALVETEAEAEADTENPVYVASSGASYYGSYPTYAGVTYTPGGGIPVPPQLPTWLPPPPYITPVAAKGSDE